MSARLLIHDATCTGSPVGLSTVWSAGARLYRGLGRLDASCAVASWGEAFAWIEQDDRPLQELQFWGHGRWGCALVGGEALDVGALSRAHPLHRGLEALRARLAPGALVWFRTCSTLGATRGADFAARLADFLGARVAGHTFIIGYHQSGLHGLSPGTRPDWAPEEGLDEGTADRPQKSRWSSPIAPRTITALQGRVPEAWFAR